ncbi:MAG: glycine cleavage system protein GcvH [Ardenticatenaceae bacterium]|nr:glycine cleavage system protein GcvH [Ardenticatenaceae bacterium]HBY94197.1 glycine cleavage system protein GcvH [Chloroflexota bacterium]
MNVPDDLLYTAEHEWVRIEGDTATVGITEYAQDALGDVVYVELPEGGDTIEAGRPFGVVESVKAASDLFAPLSGEVTEVNSTLESQPELVNSDPYGAAWMIKIRPSNLDEKASLLDAAAYRDLTQG